MAGEDGAAWRGEVETPRGAARWSPRVLAPCHSHGTFPGRPNACYLKQKQCLQYPDKGSPGTSPGLSPRPGPHSRGAPRQAAQALHGRGAGSQGTVVLASGGAAGMGPAVITMRRGSGVARGPFPREPCGKPAQSSWQSPVALLLHAAMGKGTFLNLVCE